MGSSFYYLSLSVATLSIGIYNFSVSSSGSLINCFDIVQMDKQTFKDYNSTFTTGNYPVAFINANDTSVYDVRQATSNIYSLLAIVIAIAYLIITGCGFLLSFIINYMSNQLPEDFITIGKCKKFLAFFCKILPPFLILIHWIILILIIIIWVMVVTNKCEYSTTTETGVLLNPDQFFKNAYTLNIINTAIWTVIHYGGAIFREVVYQEPFMYSPDIGAPSAWKSILFKKLGP